MAISRSQIPEQVDIFEEGGAAESNTDSYTDLYNRLSQANYEDSYNKYLQRLSQFAPEQPKMSIFQVASELGRGLLATPNTGVGSTYQGLGVGFDNISAKLKADREMHEKRRNEVAMMATQMAMQDEQRADDFLNKIALERISAANKDLEYITLEYDEVINGETVTKRTRIPNTRDRENEITNLVENKNAREIKPVTAQTNINLPGGNTKADEKAIDQIFKDQEAFGEKSEASIAVIDQVDQARLLAAEIGRENFGPFAKTTLRLREFADGIGFGDLLENPDVIAPQKALNQLSMGFTMAIVSQTKGAISNREMELFIQASPTLGSTYDGYMKQLELLERLARRDRDFYEGWLGEYTRMLDEGLKATIIQAELEKYRTTWQQNNPLFSKEETEYLEKVVASGEGLAEDFDRDEFQKSINDRKKEQATPRNETEQDQIVAMGIEGVEDGTVLRFVGPDQEGNNVYVLPDGVTFVKVKK